MLYTKFRNERTHTLPESVVGGARRSGFCSSSGTLCGPRSVAPSVPRSPCGVLVEVSFHSTPFGSSLAYGTVWDAVAAEDVLVPLPLLLDAMETALEEVAEADTEDATEAGAAAV